MEESSNKMSDRIHTFQHLENKISEKDDLIGRLRQEIAFYKK